MSNEEILAELNKGMTALHNGIKNVNQALSSANQAVLRAEAYNKGLEDGKNEVWELASKIQGLDCKIREKIYGIYKMPMIFEKFTPQEALAKLEAYEKERNEIKVGDVVRIEDSPFEEDNNVYGVITGIYANHYEILVNNGDGISRSKGVLKKTGKHIDIQSVLEEIRGAE